MFKKGIISDKSRNNVLNVDVPVRRRIQINAEFETIDNLFKTIRCTDTVNVLYHQCRKKVKILYFQGALLKCNLFKCQLLSCYPQRRKLTL